MLAAAVGASALSIDTGHQGEITALAHDPRLGVLASGSTDGTVRIWDIDVASQVKSLLVSHRIVRALDFHPRDPLLAVLEVSSPERTRITVWNWQTGRSLYTLTLDAVPLYMGFSTLGSYLVYTQARWESVSVHDARTGRRLPYLSQGFGIVSYVAFSRSERNLMTYQSSGRITYWELRTGEKLKEVTTAPGLTSSAITEDFGAMVARSSSSVVVVDVATGRTLAEEPAAGIAGIKVSPDGSRILGLPIDDRSTPLQWVHRHGVLTRLESDWPAAGVSAAVVADDAVFTGGRSGTLSRIPAFGPLREISRNKLKRIVDLATAGERVVLATADELLVFDLETRLYSSGSKNLVRSYQTSVIPAPSSRPISGVTLDEDGAIITWDQGGLLSISRGRWPAETPLAQARVRMARPAATAGRFLTLDQDGTIRLLEGWRPLITYPSPGTRDVCEVSPEILVAARTRVSSQEQPFLRINARTGETVPIPDSAIAGYALAADIPRERFFSLSVNRTDGSEVTRLRAHTGQGFEEASMAMSYDGEDAGASVVVDQRRGRAYTTLGYQTVRSWESGHVSTLEQGSGIPRKLALLDRVLVCVNLDGTVSAWDTRTGRLVLEFYLFGDGAWLAVFPQDGAFLSNGADAFIRR